MKKGGGNISIKLTNILKQTQECCNKKKCPKGSKRCKPSKKKRKKDDDEGIFGGMPNIKPTSRAIPMPQSVMNNITPVPNIPMPRQLPAYSQFRRPHAMYQRNDRPLQVQQGRGMRQPQTQPLMVSTGIQTARRQALARPRQAIARPRQELETQQLPPISVQSGIRGQGVIATQTPKQLKFNPPPQPRPIPLLNDPPTPNYRGVLDEPVPIFINPTKTRGVRSDREIRGSQGTADQPFNAEAPTPNILDYEGILMRNAEDDRRLAQRRREQMTERFKSTLKDIGEGTPREDDEEKEEERPSSPPEVIVFSDTDEELSTPREEDRQLDNQIEGVERLIAEEEDVAMAQGQAGFVDDRIADKEQTKPEINIEDQPTRGRRGRPSNKNRAEYNRRINILAETGEPTDLPFWDVLGLPDNQFKGYTNREYYGTEATQQADAGSVNTEDIRSYGSVTPGSFV